MNHNDAFCRQNDSVFIIDLENVLLMKFLSANSCRQEINSEA